MSQRPKCHEPGCMGAIPRLEGGCEGWVRCRACGLRFGWCGGIDNDLGICPDCCPNPTRDPIPEFQFEPMEVHITRRPDGRFISRNVSPETS